jgi:hypothetical protein
MDTGQYKVCGKTDEGGGDGLPRTGRVDAEVGLGESFPADPL